jgi:hypothetical protein
MHVLFAAVALLQFGGVIWAASASGAPLLAALALTMAASYAQVTVNDLVIARYTADAWRGRVYAVRYFLTFAVSGVAVWSISFLYGRGGFDLVLWSTACIAFGLVAACLVPSAPASPCRRSSPPRPKENHLSWHRPCKSGPRSRATMTRSGGSSARPSGPARPMCCRAT